MEKTFKFVLFIAVLAFCILIIGMFLLILKAVLLINPEIHMFGLTIV